MLDQKNEGILSFLITIYRMFELRFTAYNFCKNLRVLLKYKISLWPRYKYYEAKTLPYRHKTFRIKL